MNPGSDMSACAASWLTGRGPVCKAVSTPRRVGLASAAKVASRGSQYFTI